MLGVNVGWGDTRGIAVLVVSGEIPSEKKARKNNGAQSEERRFFGTRSLWRFFVEVRLFLISGFRLVVFRPADFTSPEYPL